MEKVFDLRDMITDAEMTAFEKYVDTFANEYYGKRSVSGKELLHFWADAKAPYLYKLLGNKLIVSKTVTFEKESGQMNSFRQGVNGRQSGLLFKRIESLKEVW